MSVFHTIVTHPKPHLDEIVAIWLLKKFGESVFPGISTAKLVFWGNGSGLLDGKSVDEHEREGTLLLGIGGGRFDEHPSGDGDGRKEGDCAATLVAKALGVDDDPALDKILKYVLTEDLKGNGQPFDLAPLVKILHEKFPDQPVLVIDWAVTALEAKLNEQAQFNSISETEITREEIVGPNGRKFKMATVVSDNPLGMKYARSQRGGGADVVIVKRLTGHVQIFTNKRARINLKDTVQIIRIMEQEERGSMKTTKFTELGAEGKVPGAESWYYHLEGQMLLNGSLTATDVEPTRLSLEQIQKAVRIGLDSDTFEARYASDCKAGKCITPCSWYNLGLQRCRQIRYSMRQTGS